MDLMRYLRKAKNVLWHKLDESLLNDVYFFCKKANMLRTGLNCSKFYKGKYSESDCDKAIRVLFNSRKMGAYYFEKDAAPQKYMRQYILSHIPTITTKSAILEIGPGNLPLFNEKEYTHWRGIDYNYDDRSGNIYFSGKEWGGFYENLYKGGWENISSVVNESIDIKQYDLICGSHSFEHSFKPISALKEASRVLKHNAYFVIFVPDGFSTWPGNYDKTHTLYLVPEMIDEFFMYAGTFKVLICEQFRINMDLVIVAQKISESNS